MCSDQIEDNDSEYILKKCFYYLQCKYYETLDVVDRYRFKAGEIRVKYENVIQMVNELIKYLEANLCEDAGTIMLLYEDYNKLKKIISEEVD